MELTGGGYSDSLHGGRIVGGGVSVHASKLEGLRGGRAKTDDSHVGKKAVGVASALNQLSPPAGDDVGGLFKTRGRKPTEHSAPAKQHGTSGERDLFSHHLGASESALKAREQTVAEHDLFGSLSRKAAVPHASAAHQPTSLHGGGTEEALLQLRLHDGKTQYIRTHAAKPRERAPDAQSAPWVVEDAATADPAAVRHEWEKEQREASMHIRRRNTPSDMPWEPPRPATAHAGARADGAADGGFSGRYGGGGYTGYAGVSSASAARQSTRAAPQRAGGASPSRRHNADSSLVDEILRQAARESPAPPERVPPPHRAAAVRARNSSDAARSALNDPVDWTAGAPGAERRNPITGGGLARGGRADVAGAPATHATFRREGRAHVPPVAGGRSAAGGRPMSAGPRFGHGGAVADVLDQTGLHAPTPKPPVQLPPTSDVQRVLRHDDGDAGARERRAERHAIDLGVAKACASAAGGAPSKRSAGACHRARGAFAPPTQLHAPFDQPERPNAEPAYDRVAHARESARTADSRFATSSMLATEAALRGADSHTVAGVSSKDAGAHRHSGVGRGRGAMHPRATTPTGRLDP